MKIRLLSIACLLWLQQSVVFAQITTIPELSPASAPLSGAELFYCLQSGADRKCTAAEIAATLGLTTVPTWTTGALTIVGPPVSAIFEGGAVTAEIFLNMNVNAVSNTIPDIGAQFALNSNTGFANQSTAYKVALFSAFYGTAASGPGYGFNSNTSGYAGTGGYLLVGNEGDINQLGVNATALGASTAAYGYVAVAAGAALSTAGYWVTHTGIGAGFTYGAACSYEAVACLYDDPGDVAPYLIYDLGAHSVGIDLSVGGTYSVAAISAPNVLVTGASPTMAAGQGAIYAGTNGIEIIGKANGGTYDGCWGGQSSAAIICIGDNTNNVFFPQNTIIADSGTVDATASTNGSVRLAGGLGVAKSLFVGTTFNVASLAGTGSRPACLTAAGTAEAGSLSAGLTTCP